MKAFVEETDVVRIPFEDEDGKDWIEIREEMSAGDWSDLQKNIWKLDAQLGSGGNRAQRRSARQNGTNDTDVDAALKASYDPSNVFLVFLNIKDWSFKDSKDDKVPVTMESVAKLRVSVASILVQEIEERNPTSPFDSQGQTSNIMSS